MGAFVQQSFILLALAYTLGLLSAAWLVRVLGRRPAAHAKRSRERVQEAAWSTAPDGPDPLWEHSFVDLTTAERR